MGQPQQLGAALEIDEMFTGLKPELAAKCRTAFRMGQMEYQAIKNGRANFQELNGSEKQGSQKKKSTALSKMNLIGDSSPLVKQASKEQAMKSVADVAFVFGHKLNRDAVEAMANVILTGEWTEAELELAAAYIPTDFDMCQTITYNRTINPTVFAKVRSMPHVMRGRLFGHKEAVNYSASQEEPLHEVFEPVRRREQTLFLMR